MKKECPRCNQNKLLVDYYPRGRKECFPDSAAGYSHVCKECVKAERRLYVVENKNKCKQSDRKYHLSKYGLTPASYNQMFITQNGICLGCSRHQSEFNRALVVDHCHKTGNVRGLLCWQCNSALGMIRDSRSTLSNLSTYLTNSEAADQNTAVENASFLRK